jgi:predicted nucleotidyltransferase
VGITPQETAATLRRRSAETRRQAEVRAAEARARALAAIRATLPPGARAWLIGSLAWGGFGVRSDIDVVLSGVTGPQATAVETAVCRAVGAEVDLLTLEHLPPSFRERIEHEGVAVHGG